MAPFLRSRTAIVFLGAAAVLYAALGFVPQLDGPGYESSLVAGVTLPFLVGIWTALEHAKARPEPFDGFCRGVANGGALFGVAFFITLLHGLRSGFCDALSGTQNYVLGPGIGALLAGVWGAVAGEVAGGRDRPWLRALTAVSLAVTGPLASFLLSFSRFYTSPMVFAYDPFAGYFSGTLYDTVVDLSGLMSYRVASASTLFAFLVAALHLGHDDKKRLAYQDIGRPGMLVVGAIAAAFSIGCMLSGDKLGHWQTSDTIAEELGAVVSGERCEVYYPRGMDPAEVQRFARDCDAHVVAGEQWLGGTGPDRVTAFLFKSPQHKQALMGAGRTYVAKPWRNEIYLQRLDYPHRVLGHEVMHVVAGVFGRGPFRVAGDLGGFIPNPGLIEGLAVAASPKEEDLTPAEWAKTMKDLQILPALSELFALGFLGENSSTAYTVSGAFVGWVHATYGRDAVAAWYGGGELSEITGSPWEDLEERWHASLDEIQVTEAALAQAKERFDRPAIFGRRCPRVVDRCKRDARELADDGDEEGAIALFEEAMALDPSDASLRVEVAVLTARLGRIDEAKDVLGALADDTALPIVVRDAARVELGDLELAAGNGAAAVERYKEAMLHMVDEDDKRTLEVKIAAAESDVARPAIVALLIGRDGRDPDRTEAAELLGVWGERSVDDGLPQYLMARYYLDEGAFELAADRLDRALTRRQTVERVRVEAERLRIIVACGLSDSNTAREVYAGYAARADVPKARRESVGRLVERCTRAPLPAPRAAPGGAEPGPERGGADPDAGGAGAPTGAGGAEGGR